MKSCAVIERNSATPLAAEAGGAVFSQCGWDTFLTASWTLL